MKEKIEIGEIQKYIDRNELDTAYKEITKKAIQLAEEIASKRGVSLEELENENNLEDKFYYIQTKFQEQSQAFWKMQKLMEMFLTWEIAPEDDLGVTYEEKLIKYVKTYNEIIDEFTQYEELEKEIKKTGYEKLKNEKVNKLIEIFKEMLIYKNQKYDDNWNFRQWVEKTYENYTFYKEMLSNILSQTESNIFCRKIDSEGKEEFVQTNNIENIFALNNIYEILKDKKLGYKECANLTEDE